MKQQDLNPDNVADRRISRVIASSLILGFVVYGIVAASREQSIPPLYGITAFCGYAILSSFLMTWIVARLYRQHGIRQMKFDLANMILLSALIALPFAASNMFWDLLKIGLVKRMAEDKTLVLLLLTGGAGVLLLPILFITEALFAWYNTYVKHRDS